MRLPNHPLSLPSAALLALLAACSGGGGSGPTGTADFLVTDAPTDELLSFSARVTELRLRTDSGALSGNYLTAPVTLEFLGLQGVSAWLSSSSVPTGSYDAVVLRFDPSSINAKALNGDTVVVTSGSNQLTALLPAVVTVSDDGYVRFETDLDLNSSLSGQVSSGSLVFNPSGSCSSGGGFEAPIDEIKGVVQSVDSVNQSLVIQAYVDDDLIVPLGPVTVSVTGGTTLFDDNNQAFGSSSAFFSFLVPGSSLLEVHGNLSSTGQVNATKIEVEDQVGGVSGGNTLVRIEGIVSSLEGNSFELLIQEIVKGAAVAQPVLNGLGNPAAITVSFNESTVFKFDSEALTTSASLGVGQEIKAKFATFSSEPFPAFEVEIDDTPSLMQGTVRDLTSYPQAVGIELSQQSAAILSAGQSHQTSALVLGLGNEVLPPALQVGQRVRFLGGLVTGAAPDSNPTMLASELTALPTQLIGAVVTSVDPASQSLTILGGRLDLDSQGQELGPTAIRLDTGSTLWAQQGAGGPQPLNWADLVPGDQVDLEVSPGSSWSEMRAQRLLRR